MAFCSKCGAQVNEGEKFCPSCGAPLQAAPEAEKKIDTSDISEKVTAFMNSGEDKTSQFETGDVEANKAMAILAYITWLVLIPLFAAKDSKFARFHTNQGLVLAICELIIIIIGYIPIIGWIVRVLGGLVAFIFAIMGIIGAAKGEAKTLPIIGKYTIIK